MSQPELRETTPGNGPSETSLEKQDGDPGGVQPMVTASLRLPAYVVERLKSEAEQEGVRAIVLIRRVLEDHVRGLGTDLQGIRSQLDRIERAVTRS